MAARPIVTLNTTTPQLEVPQAGDTYYFPRAINPGTLTTDVNVIDAAVTWNNAGVTFTAAKVNVTDTASAAASKLLDLQVGGTSVFNVRKSSKIQFNNLAILDNTAGGAAYWYYNGSSTRTGWNSGGFVVANESSYSFASSTQATTTPDTYLYRDAANTLALRNSTNPQTLRVYNTGDPTNGEWGFMRFSSNVFEIGATKAGTGTERPLSITATSVRIATLPTSDPAVANQLFTQTATQLGGTGTTKVLCVSAG